MQRSGVPFHHLQQHFANTNFHVRLRKQELAAPQTLGDVRRDPPELRAAVKKHTLGRLFDVVRALIRLRQLRQGIVFI